MPGTDCFKHFFSFFNPHSSLMKYVLLLFLMLQLEKLRLVEAQLLAQGILLVNGRAKIQTQESVLLIVFLHIVWPLDTQVT